MENYFQKHIALPQKYIIFVIGLIIKCPIPIVR